MVATEISNDSHKFEAAGAEIEHLSLRSLLCFLLCFATLSVSLTSVMEHREAGVPAPWPLCHMQSASGINTPTALDWEDLLHVVDDDYFDTIDTGIEIDDGRARSGTTDYSATLSSPDTFTTFFKILDRSDKGHNASLSNAAGTSFHPQFSQDGWTSFNDPTLLPFEDSTLAAINTASSSPLQHGAQNTQSDENVSSSQSSAPADSKKHRCHICGRPFKYPKDVERHHKSMHSSDKPYKCHHKFCKYYEKGFPRKDALKKHMQRHT